MVLIEFILVQIRTVGQIKIITMIVDGGDATDVADLVVVTIVFNDVGDSVILVYHNTIGMVMQS